MSLLTALNMLDDPDLLEDVDTYELRVVDDTLKRLTDPDEDATLVLTAVIDGRKRTLLHDFEGDTERLPEILEALLEENMTVWYKDGSNEQIIESFDDLTALLKTLDSNPFVEEIQESIRAAL